MSGYHETFMASSRKFYIQHITQALRKMYIQYLQLIMIFGRINFNVPLTCPIYLLIKLKLHEYKRLTWISNHQHFCVYFNMQPYSRLKLNDNIFHTWNNKFKGNKFDFIKLVPSYFTQYIKAPIVHTLAKKSFILYFNPPYLFIIFSTYLFFLSHA